VPFPRQNRGPETSESLSREETEQVDLTIQTFSRLRGSFPEAAC